MNGRACGTKQTHKEIIHTPQEIMKRKEIVSSPEMRSRNQKEKYFVKYETGVKISVVH